MAAHSVLRDGMQGARGSEWLIPFVSSPDTGRRSRTAREGLPAAAPASGCYAVTCRSRSATQQTARKASAHTGCDKIARSRRCAPRHRSPGCRHDTARVASVREWRQAAAPASGCYAVTCRSRYLRRSPCDHRDFVSNAAHGGLDQRFLSLQFDFRRLKAAPGTPRRSAGGRCWAVPATTAMRCAGTTWHPRFPTDRA